MNPDPTQYCTDEDLSIRSAGDFSLLCPKDQKLAEGSDGVFLAGQPWTLVSASVDFEEAGVGPGHVVQLTKTSIFRGTEELAIAGVEGGTLHLRRKGLEPDLGHPPGPPSGATGIGFAVATLTPQIRNASRELDRRFDAASLLSGRRSVPGFQPGEITEVCALLVLRVQYDAMTRSSGEQADRFASQARGRQSDLDTLLARLTSPWDPVELPTRPDSPFSTHLSR